MISARAAGIHDFLGRLNGFEDFQYHFAGGEQARRFTEQVGSSTLMKRSALPASCCISRRIVELTMTSSTEERCHAICAAREKSEREGARFQYYVLRLALTLTPEILRWTLFLSDG